MKLLIAGSREIDSFDFAENIITRSLELLSREIDLPVTQVVSGTAQGMDRHGESWAAKVSVPVVRFYADWKGLGKAAGPIRNGEMAQYCDAAVVAINNDSRGSTNMANQMIAQRKPLIVFRLKEMKPVGLEVWGSSGLIKTSGSVCDSSRPPF